VATDTRVTGSAGPSPCRPLRQPGAARAHHPRPRVAPGRLVLTAPGCCRS
jgi:hypothetical protein